MKIPHHLWLHIKIRTGWRLQFIFALLKKKAQKPGANE